MPLLHIRLQDMALGVLKHQGTLEQQRLGEGAGAHCEVQHRLEHVAVQDGLVECHWERPEAHWVLVSILPGHL